MSFASPSENLKIWDVDRQHVLIKNCLKLFLREIKTLFPRWISQDFSRIICQGVKVPEFWVGLDRTLSFSPILHCSWRLKLSTINSGSFTFPNSTVSLICFSPLLLNAVFALRDIRLVGFLAPQHTCRSRSQNSSGLSLLTGDPRISSIGGIPSDFYALRVFRSSTRQF